MKLLINKFVTKNLKIPIIKSGKNLYNSLPMLLGVIFLLGLINSLIPKSAYPLLFHKSILLDSIIGSSLGSIMAGNPITSYVFAGEFLKQGISLVAVTAFLVAWVSVGLIQLPAESMMLGKKFALLRNGLSFLFSLIVATATVFLVNLI